jgi:hypothetical protein
MTENSYFNLRLRLIDFLKVTVQISVKLIFFLSIPFVIFYHTFIEGLNMFHIK